MNFLFGWFWITIGFAAGATLGMKFERDDWLGGYESLRRRLVRLAHIAFIALGAINVLFGLSVDRLDFTVGGFELASWAWLIGAVAMPLCCYLMAWRPTLKPIFGLPVAALITAGVTTVIAAIRAFG